MSAKNKELPSDALKRTTQWVFSQEIPSDITVHVDRATFPLHKFPLMSKCGYFQMLVPKSTDYIRIPNIPGGADSFELAAKFCYGKFFEMTKENIAMLRCAAEYLEMTEENHTGNLISLAESYLSEVTLKTLAGAVSVLRSSQSLLPFAEDLKLVNQCIDAIAALACKDESDLIVVSSSIHVEPDLEWVEDLLGLRIDFFQRVITAMMARGFKQFALCPLLMLYAQKSLHGFEEKGMDRAEERENRVVLETIMSFLPRDKNVIPVSFFSKMLRAAIHLETTVACRLDLEKRIGQQLNDAVLDDLCFPSDSITKSTVLDVDAVYRIMIEFLENVMRNKSSSSEFEMDCVTSLMESYLIEIASDPNLPVSKFVEFSKIIPEQARINDDRLYTAVDTYLKVHRDLSESEKRTICSAISCQKLSRVACTHAAQNSRLPAQMVIQVLYTEQNRLRESMELNETLLLSPRVTTTNIPSSLQHENEVLKLELLKMKMKLKEVEKFPRRVPQKSFVNSVTKRIGWFYPFARERVTPPNVQGCNYIRKARRFSMS